MLTKTEIDDFIANLPESSRLGLKVMQDLEDWPVDDAEEISAVLNSISARLNTESGQAKLLSYSPAKLLKAVSYINTPRFARLIQFIGKKNYLLISEMVGDKDVSPEMEIMHEACKATMLIRICYMLHYRIVHELLGPQAVREITLEILKQE